MEMEEVTGQAGVGVADQPGDHHRAGPGQRVRHDPRRRPVAAGRRVRGRSAPCGTPGKGQITTAAIDSMTFLGPVYVGERVEIVAEVTYVGRTSIETRIEIYAEPFDRPERRKVAVGYALYVALDEDGRRPAAGPATADRDRGRPPPPRGGPRPPGRPPGPPGRRPGRRWREPGRA